MAYGRIYTKGVFMPLNIRDAEVDRLTKQLARAQMKKSLWERIKQLRDEIAAYPDSGVILDKAFFDEVSGEAGE